MAVAILCLDIAHGHATCVQADDHAVDVGEPSEPLGT